MKSYTRHAQLAIAIGGLATTGALAILLADPIGASWRGDHTHWRLDHFLLPVIVAVTIAAGHLCGKALRELRPAALGFALVFAVGTLLTVYSSVGAQRAAIDIAGAQVAADNKQLTAKWSDLERAKQRLEMAESMVAREMTGERCGRRCQDWRLRADEVRAHIAAIERQIAGMGSEKVAPLTKSQALAQAMAVLGYDKGRVEIIARTFEPFAFALLFELAAIVAFGYGFGGRPATRSAPSAKVIDIHTRTELDQVSTTTDDEIEEARKHFVTNRASLPYPEVSEDAMTRGLAVLAESPENNNPELMKRLRCSASQATRISRNAEAMGFTKREQVTSGDKRRVLIKSAA